MVPVLFMGAPTPVIEKLVSETGFETALKQMEFFCKVKKLSD